MMEMTNDLNNKEEEARILRQNLSAALDDVASLKDECSSHKEVSAKFVRKIDVLQCEVDELLEENNVSYTFLHICRFDCDYCCSCLV